MYCLISTILCIDLFRLVTEKSDMAEVDEGASGGSPKAKPVLKKKVAGRAMAATKRKKASRDDDEEDGEEGEDARPRKLNGFSKPLKVSPELSEWLGGEKQISRPQLVKRFWAYAKVCFYQFLEAISSRLLFIPLKDQALTES